MNIKQWQQRIIRTGRQQVVALLGAMRRLRGAVQPGIGSGVGASGGGLRQRAAVVAGLAMLVLLGVLLLLAAPGIHPSAQAGATNGGSATTSPSASTSGRQGVTKRQVQVAGTPTPTDTPAATPTPTAPPAQPTNTPLPPTPSATPSPAPSWHTVGTWSGTAPQSAFATVTGVTGRAANIRVDWTCSLPGNGGGGVWQIGFEAAPTGGSSAGSQGGGVWCKSGQTSGTMTFNADTSAYGSSWDVSMIDSADAAGGWTATVLVWY